MSAKMKSSGAWFVVLGLLFLVYFLYNGKKESFDNKEFSKQNGEQSPLHHVKNSNESEPVLSCSNKCSQEHRLQQLREKCKKYPELQRPPNEIPFERLMVDDKHKVIYCQVSKAGSTSFINLLYNAVTGTTGKGHHFPKYREKVGLLWLDRFSKEEQARRLRDYHKILPVRHPFDRLVSCYNCKFTHPTAQYTWRDHGPAMIRMFRKTSHGSNTQLENRKGATWQEFVKYVSYLEDQKPEKHNHHWNKIIDECFPCSIDYDTIVKVETMEQDMAPILSRLHVTDFPSFNVRRLDEETHEPLGLIANKILDSYTRIAPQLVQKLQKMYEVDMDLFGYSFNTTTMYASCGSSNCNSTSCC